MTKCAVCESSVSDTAYCAGCNKHFGFCCASVTEAGYRKLGAERRASWRCARCKAGSLSASPIPASSVKANSPNSMEKSHITLDRIFDEICSLKRQLEGLPTLIEEVRNIKSEIADIKSTCEYNSACISDQNTKMFDLDKRVSEIQAVQLALDLANKEIAELKTESADRDQKLRLNNIEIKGLVEKKNENLYDIVDAISKKIGCELPKTQINYIARVPTYNIKEKSIIVSVHNRYIKENFVAAARSYKSLLSADFLIGDTGHKVFINDHLTPANKRLLSLTKTRTKEKGYSYVWVKHCKIHVRKNDSSKVFIISKESDLNKII